MVHALTEAHRVLASPGLLLDLRPDRDPGGRRAKLLDAYVVIRGSDVEAGALVEKPSYYSDFVAGDRAVEQVIRKHLLALQAVQIFRLRWYFRPLAILQPTLSADWTASGLPKYLPG